MGIKTIYFRLQPLFTLFTTGFKCLLVGLLITLQLQSIAGEPLNRRYKEYYPSGKIKVKGRYKQGKKHANWFYFSETGIMTKRERYKADVLQVVYTYNEKGKLATITDKNGKVVNKPDCGCQ